MKSGQRARVPHGAVGERLRRFRDERGISVRAFARVLGISHTTLANMETGKAKIDADELPRIAAALGVNPCRFFQDDEAAGVSGAGVSYRATLLEEAVARLPVPERELVRGLLEVNQRYIKHLRGEGRDEA